MQRQFLKGRLSVASTKRRVLGAAVGVALVGTFTGVALANLGVGFGSLNLVADASNNDVVHLNSDCVKFQTKDPTHIRVQQVSFDAGGVSGWQHHPASCSWR